MGKILTSTADTIPGFEVTATLGIVQGNTVRARHMGRDIMAGLKNIVGGEIASYTELLATARTEALERMVQEAQARDADAIVAIRFETGSVMEMASELFVYGTAVKIKPIT